jgi:hypothetical protein
MLKEIGDVEEMLLDGATGGSLDLDFTRDSRSSMRFKIARLAESNLWPRSGPNLRKPFRDTHVEGSTC